MSESRPSFTARHKGDDRYKDWVVSDEEDAPTADVRLERARGMAVDLGCVLGCHGLALDDYELVWGEGWTNEEEESFLDKLMWSFNFHTKRAEA